GGRLHFTRGYRTWRRGEGPARVDAQTMRLRRLAAHDRPGEITQCFRGRRCGSFRSSTTAPRSEWGEGVRMECGGECRTYGAEDWPKCLPRPHQGCWVSFRL